MLQMLITSINEESQTIQYKNPSKLFFNSMSNIKSIEPSLLSIDKISFRSTESVIYNIKYFKNLDSANSLYLTFNNVDGYIEESNENKYLIFASTDKNKEAVENYTELWNEIKYQFKMIRGNKPIERGKGFMKIKFESDGDLPLAKILSIPVCIVTVGSAFQENDNYYPQVHLHECLYEHEYKDDNF